MAHNKKRNTAFLFESLMREGTKALIEKDFKKANFVKSLVIKYFNSSSEMKKELDLYNALRKNDIENKLAEKYLNEVKLRHNNLDKKKIFNEQTSLINLINKTLGNNFYNNFIPNYKDIATISQIFSDQTAIKDKILLENTILSELSKENDKKTLQPVDKLLYKSFTKRFNEKYSGLLSEQKDLLTKFISSFSDNGLELKIYLNEEIDRLKSIIEESLSLDEIKIDEEMVKKTKEVDKFLNEFKNNKEITNSLLEKILKIQQFAYEVKNNA